MEIMSTRDVVERENPSPVNSPHSNGSSTSSSNGSSSLYLIPTPPHTPTPTHTPTGPGSKPRSHDSNPYPTTFVQADTTTFKQVVQMLTGSSDTAKPPPNSAAARCGIPPIKSAGQKKQGYKLYERRNSLKNGLMINTFVPGFPPNSGFSPGRKPEILSPSILDFPSLVLSPVTPMNEDTLRKAPAAAEEEDRAIAEKKFYFHPSPRTDGGGEPQLLPLFPVTSPRVSGSS